MGIEGSSITEIEGGWRERERKRYERLQRWKESGRYNKETATQT
jgi:hypothetical protein